MVCVTDNLMIVLMSYLGLCFWHYCAWKHSVLMYCRRH